MVRILQNFQLTARAMPLQLLVIERRVADGNLCIGRTMHDERVAGELRRRVDGAMALERVKETGFQRVAEVVGPALFVRAPHHVGSGDGADLGIRVSHSRPQDHLPNGRFLDGCQHRDGTTQTVPEQRDAVRVHKRQRRRIFKYSAGLVHHRCQPSIAVPARTLAASRVVKANHRVAGLLKTASRLHKQSVDPDARTDKTMTDDHRRPALPVVAQRGFWLVNGECQLIIPAMKLTTVFHMQAPFLGL